VSEGSAPPAGPSAPRPSAAAPRIGILGGSFDPPHVGHVLLAQDAIDSLALDALLVIPAGAQPLKAAAGASGAQRLAMARAAFGALPRVTVDPVEIDRGGLSFMIETVEHLEGRSPGAEFLLLLGADAAAHLDRWRDPERLLERVRLVIATRSGPEDAPVRTPWTRWPGVRAPIRLAGRRVDVSSSEIRARVASGRSIHGFVPEAVATLIATSGLYLSRNAC
jgi:nicotinate-nucleotide adenylyltransferase